MSHGHSVYTLVSALMLVSLGLIWSKNTALNIFIKLVLFFAGVWGFIERFVP